LPLEASTMSAEHEGPWSSTWIFPGTWIMLPANTDWAWCWWFSVCRGHL
jgi:hypothetical protein